MFRAKPHSVLSIFEKFKIVIKNEEPFLYPPVIKKTILSILLTIAKESFALLGKEYTFPRARYFNQQS